MNLRDITSFLEMLAPLAFQEDYDNSGLIVGHPDKELTGALISLDCTESVIDEAIQLGFNLIISHHLFKFNAQIDEGKMTMTRQNVVCACNVLEFHANALMIYPLYQPNDNLYTLLS
jgi:putative NIF3 family GTP cyclohydrolase 1 type 2